VTALSLNPSRTALVLIDMMPRILTLPTAPRTGEQVLGSAVRLMTATRSAGGLVVLVRVERPGVDAQPPGSGFAPECTPQSGDVEIIKHTWGAFHDTELHGALQAEGIETVMLGGIATNFGVESTGRAADEHGYQVVFVEDAMTGLDAHAHEFAVSYVFPRLGPVCDTQQVLSVLAANS
jgi:nicotinamidase-related amidase